MDSRLKIDSASRVATATSSRFAKVDGCCSYAILSGRFVFGFGVIGKEKDFGDGYWTGNGGKSFGVGSSRVLNPQIAP